MKITAQTINILTVIIFSLILNKCASESSFDSDYYPLQKLISIPEITDSERSEFNRNVKSEFTSISGENNNKISGYKTANKIFLEKVITPLIKPHLNELNGMSKTEKINYLTLFSFEIYQRYFGKDYYRWGGDIFDLDDPQEKGVRSSFAYGLDCSGFVAIPYELAVYFNLISEENALFSSQGYKKFCLATNRKDIGGRNGTSNNYRLDTPELAEIGEVVFSLDKGQIPTQEQINMLQPGDIVGRSGHFGIIAELNGIPYYFESGGRVVPKNHGVPVKVEEALKQIASAREISVRRCLNFTH
jgi:hypothetical protein